MIREAPEALRGFLLFKVPCDRIFSKSSENSRSSRIFRIKKEGIDLVIDCTDNFPTRYIINDGAFKKKIPWIYGGAVENHGNIKTFFPDEGPCLRCMMMHPLEKNETQSADTTVF